MATSKIVRSYGFKPQPEDIRDFKFSIANPMLVLPSSVDLRQKLPAVYNQDVLGSCTANAISGLIQSQLKSFKPSRLFIYYNERVLEGTVSQDAGAFIRDGIKSVNKLGVCSEASLPYAIKKFSEVPSQACYLEASKYKASAYYAVGQSLSELKSALAANYPVAFGFMVKHSLESPVTAKTGIYSPKSDEPILGGHAVCLVGYDDSTSMFLVRNSWGSLWGLKGHFYMPYSEVLDPKISSDFWVINEFKASVDIKVSAKLTT